MNFNRLENLMTEKKLSVKELADKIDMSYEGLNKAFKAKSFKVDTLEKISSVLGVTVPYFYVDVLEEKEGGVEYKIFHLEKLLEEKEKQIKDKETIINLLMNK